MTSVLVVATFVLAVVYAVAGGVFASRLSRKIDSNLDWYALFLHVQQHTMVWAKLNEAVRDSSQSSEYLALKRTIWIFYAAFFPICTLAFISKFAGW